MITNGPFVRKGAEAPVDYAAIDPVTREAAIDAWGWKSSKPRSDPVIPRVETHSFDPYNQARPDLYSFTRDAKEAITRFDQTRLDGRYIGTVETTSNGNPRESVLRIQWMKNGGADIEFTMVGTNTNLEPICHGYCKKTDLGSVIPGELGRLGWVVVATQLHGRDILRSQTEHLFSLPLFEAIATGVAFAIYKDDGRIRELHPTLGTMAPAGIGSSMSESIHGTGAERWLRADACDVNAMIRASDKFTPVVWDTFATSKAMEVTPLHEGRAVGSLYPLKRNNTALVDGVTVDRIVVGERPVSYKDYPEASIFKYEAAAFSNAYDAKTPVAVFDVNPQAYADSNNRLRLKTHIVQPKVGSKWIVPGRGEVNVADSEVDLATTEIAPWDQHFIAAIETAMFKLRTDQGGAVVVQ